jgi:hypothetical protein
MMDYQEMAGLHGLNRFHVKHIWSDILSNGRSTPENVADSCRCWTTWNITNCCMEGVDSYMVLSRIDIRQQRESGYQA